MSMICTRVSEHLNQELELKAQELNIDKSTLIRDFIRKGLVNFQANKSSRLDMAELIKRNISYTIMSHCLMEMVVADYVEKGSELCEKAHLKAEKLMNHLLKKFSNYSFESTEFIKFGTESERDN